MRLVLIRVVFMALAIVALSLPVSSSAFPFWHRRASHDLVARTPVFDNQNSPRANQPDGPCVLGNDFTVLPGHKIVITSMGAFDDGCDGFHGRVLVGVYNRETGRRVEGTFVAFEAPGTSYELANKTRWQNVGPVILKEGRYTVIAANYGPSHGNKGAEDGYSALLERRVSPLQCNTLDGALIVDGARWLNQRQSWESLPEAIPAWTGVRDATEKRRPSFAAGSFAVKREPLPNAGGARALLIPSHPDRPKSVPEPASKWLAVVLLLSLILVHASVQDRGFRRLV